MENKAKIRTNFKIIDHTADIGIHAVGKTPEELFESCALGMIYIIMGDQNFCAEAKRNIQVEGIDNEDLLYSFLSDVLYFVDGEDFITTGFRNSVIKDGKFETTALGFHLNPENHHIETEIKAVTYHLMKIVENEGVWKTDVIFDV